MLKWEIFIRNISIEYGVWHKKGAFSNQLSNIVLAD